MALKEITQFITKNGFIIRLSLEYTIIILIFIISVKLGGKLDFTSLFKEVFCNGKHNDLNDPIKVGLFFSSFILLFIIIALRLRLQNRIK